MAKIKRPQEEFHCPVCGAAVSAAAKSCPECGTCEKSGWGADAADDGLDLSDDEFDYDKFVGEEFGHGAPKKGTQRLWPIVAFILLIALALPLLRSCSP